MSLGLVASQFEDGIEKIYDALAALVVLAILMATASKFMITQ